MIVVTRKMGFAHRVADQVIFVDEGLVVEEGTPSVIIDRPREERTRKLLYKVR